MARITDPADVSDPLLREICVRALWVARLDDIDIIFDIAASEEYNPITKALGWYGKPRVSYGSPIWNPDEPKTRLHLHALEVGPDKIASDILEDRLDDDLTNLREELEFWLSMDRARWDVLWDELVSPWRTPTRRWRRTVPRWLELLVTEDLIKEYWRTVFEQPPVPPEPPSPPPGPVKPTDIDHPQLREFAERAVWVAMLDGVSDYLMDIARDDEADEADEAGEDDVSDGDTDDDVPPDWERNPFTVVGEYLVTVMESQSQLLEADMIDWLAEDPEHWTIYRMTALDPWQESPGRYREGVPDWVVALGTETQVAHYRHDRYGRRLYPSVDDDEPRDDDDD